jgi:hypothetical protein
MALIGQLQMADREDNLVVVQVVPVGSLTIVGSSSAASLWKQDTKPSTEWMFLTD